MSAPRYLRPRRRSPSRLLVLSLFVSAALGLSSCGEGAEPQAGDKGERSPSAGGVEGGGAAVDGVGGVGGASDSATAKGEKCLPVRSAHAIPVRQALHTERAVAPVSVMLVSELVGRVDAFCAGCHRAPAALGSFSYTTESFRTAVPDGAPALILSQDEAARMPPASPYPIRDDLRELAGQLAAWLEQGRPAVTFELPVQERQDEQSSDEPYAFDERAGSGFTNLGDCIPAAEIVGADVDEADAARDDMFARVKTFKDLPKSLRDTDLFTLDTETLARHRTVTVAPAYQLWTFDAGKLRHLRLPLGTSLKLDEAGEEFEIPPNTRLYKTFTKAVVDANGRVGHRKIETRLIVARPDLEGEGAPTVAAVFGTYVWNEAETDATLLEKPYLGTALDDPELNTFTFKDLIKPYVADERKFRSALEGIENHEGTVLERPLPGTKEYPVPGWHRCLQCHQGSPTKNFVLGISPMQLNRRRLGEGGVYEPAGEDELTQAQRLIDYGLITGVDRASELTKLEDSAGARKPRNAYELRAQAYLLGNCSGCHNPRGYPTQLNPSLAFLDFRPGGSVFGFSLSHTSPLRKRKGVDAGWRYVDPTLSQRPLDEQAQSERVQGTIRVPRTEVGPWQSLMYRNVQTPRTYDEEDILFPHMPLHIAGIDCRAANIIGSWIASIPSASGTGSNGNIDEGVLVDSDTAEARAAADERVRIFLESQPACQPTDDLRDWGAEAPNFTDLAPPVGIPDRPHFFEEDFSEVKGEFRPRGGDWQKDMLQSKYSDILAFEPSAELSRFVATEVPFDFWQEKPECDFGDAALPDGELPSWMSPEVRPDGDLRRLYYTLPGAAVFGAICSNCHGLRGTAESNLASTIAGLTGGKTRVANWAQGLFGPTSAPLTNLELFERESLADETRLGDSGAAKYLMFMALGGTEALIPAAALRQVASAQVASQPRLGDVASFATANMLELAREICANTIQFSTASDSTIAAPYDPERGQYAAPEAVSEIVVTRNGEYLLYNELCAVDNPRPVRSLFFTAPDSSRVEGFLARADFDAVAWNGSDADPWCVDRDSLYKPPGKQICPTQNDISAIPNAFARRGVLNVGYAVYSYLKLTFGDPSEWRPGFDQCEQRSKGAR